MNGKRLKKYHVGEVRGNQPFVDPAVKLPYINEGPVPAEIVSSVLKTIYRLGKKFVYGLESGSERESDAAGAGEGLFNAYIDPELRKIFKNIRYETASSDTLARVYKDVNGKPHPQELGGLAVPIHDSRGNVVGGTVYENKKVKGNPVYRRHEIGHIVFEHRLARRGIDPRSVPQEAHERFAEAFEGVDIGGEIGIAGN